ncbi:hypothetical protein GCM10025770_37170 [Viridibacterium curvum]|uniref:Outer membrane protein beta-barrel domain-containing protein n=2 Tax=Viridibacterium curvum TaxID=1101404 RepID=A0ABP9R5D4_9RHOO
MTYSRANAVTTTGRLQYFDNFDAAQIGRTGNNDLTQSRLSGGLVLGYGQQFNQLFIGVEASASTLYFNRDHEKREIFDSPVAPAGTGMTIKQSVSADWLAGLRLRAGLTDHNRLIYLTGGLAATRIKMETTYVDDAWSGYSQGSRSKNKLGWSLGFGGEYNVGKSWALRGEYLYSRFGYTSVTTDVTSTNNSGGTLDHRANLEVHSLYLGLTRRFQ